MPVDSAAPRIDLANEFAAVRVEVDTSANGRRLKITDLESGECVYFDPFELATLTAITPRDLDRLATPR
jgi:hypothetical protein